MPNKYAKADVKYQINVKKQYWVSINEQKQMAEYQ